MEFYILFCNNSNKDYGSGDGGRLTAIW